MSSVRSRGNVAAVGLACVITAVATVSAPIALSPDPPGARGTAQSVINAAQAGSAALGSSDYAVPANATVVAPFGSDASAGTLAAPVRTLAHAISVARAGSTILLRRGTYHESVTVFKALTIESYPGEVVWLDGSTAVTGWRQVGTTWVHDGWTAQFSSVPSYTASVPTGPYSSFVNAAHPLAAHPDQVWINSAALHQVATGNAVGPGDFYTDYVRHSIVIGRSPRGSDVRASDLQLAITSYGPNVTVRGVGVRRYATPVNKIGAVRLVGNRNALRDVLVTQVATTGIAISGTNASLNNVTVTRNGMLGLTATHADGLTVRGLVSTDNNTEGFNYSPVSGGAKIGRSRSVTVDHSVFNGNHGYGFWCDESCHGVAVTNSTMSHNAWHGLTYEISSTAVIVNNVIADNGGDGVKINDSDHVQVWNNTVSGNARGVEVVQDERLASDESIPGHDPRRSQPDPTEPWIISDIQIMNNVFTPLPGSYQLFVLDHSGRYSADDLHIAVDGNRFVHMDGAVEIVWGGRSARQVRYSSTATFATASGQGAFNGEIDPSGDVLVPARPHPLPAAVARAAGTSPGLRGLGAL